MFNILLLAWIVGRTCGEWLTKGGDGYYNGCEHSSAAGLWQLYRLRERADTLRALHGMPLMA